MNDRGKKQRYYFWRIGMIFVCCLAVVLGGCRKASEPADYTEYKIIKYFENGPLQVEVKVSKDIITLSDLLAVELNAYIEPGYSVSFPKLSDDLSDFKIYDDSEAGKKLGADNKVVVTHRYRLEPLMSGNCQLPGLKFTFQKETLDTSSDAPGSLLTEPIGITVTLTLPDDPNQSIADIEDVVEIPANYTRWIILTIIAAAIILGIMAGLRFRPIKLEAVQKVYRPAHEIAFEMLKRISDEKLVEQGLIKEFYEKLSFCLRQYIENRFRLRAPEQTTEEFMEELKKSDVLKTEYKQELKRFLEHCDLVKFAKYRPDNDQINQSLTMAERFVENTKSQESQVEIP